MKPNETFIQWKGTDVCMDFRCECGHANHYDGYFAYNIKCGHCGSVFELGTQVTATKVDNNRPYLEPMQDPEDETTNI